MAVQINQGHMASSRSSHAVYWDLVSENKNKQTQKWNALRLFAIPIILLVWKEKIFVRQLTMSWISLLTDIECIFNSWVTIAQPCTVIHILTTDPLYFMFGYDPVSSPVSHKELHCSEIFRCIITATTQTEKGTRTQSIWNTNLTN